MSELSQLPAAAPSIAQDPPLEPEGSGFARAHYVLIFFLLTALVAWLLSGFYQVRTGQVAIVERLGQYLSASEGKVIQIDHGLHYRLPWPIDRVSLISVQQNFTLQINAFNASPAEYADFKRDLLRQGWEPEVINAFYDPYAVTADKSVVHIEINVLFRINDAAAWLTSVSHEFHQNYDPNSPTDMRNSLFQQIAQRVIVSQTAKMPLDGVLREGRAELQRGIQSAFQDGLEVPDPSDPTGARRLSLGASIQSVTLSVSQVPDAVKPAYDNLVTQRSLAETVKSRADADAAAAVARAQGEMGTLISDAETYRQNTVQAARGEADRFKEVFTQYNNAPQMTRWNLFVDAVKTVSGAAKRIVFAQPGQRTLIVVDPPQYDAGQVQGGK